MHLQARKAALESGISPLDYMLQVMRNPRADAKRRDAMAAAAAPYVHARLSSVQHGGQPGGAPIETRNVTRIELVPAVISAKSDDDCQD